MTTIKVTKVSRNGDACMLDVVPQTNYVPAVHDRIRPINSRYSYVITSVRADPLRIIINGCSSEIVEGVYVVDAMGLMPKFLGSMEKVKIEQRKVTGTFYPVSIFGNPTTLKDQILVVLTYQQINNRIPGKRYTIVSDTRSESNITLVLNEPVAEEGHLYYIYGLMRKAPFIRRAEKIEIGLFPRFVDESWTDESRKHDPFSAWTQVESLAVPTELDEAKEQRDIEEAEYDVEDDDIDFEDYSEQQEKVKVEAITQPETIKQEGFAEESYESVGTFSCGNVKGRLLGGTIPSNITLTAGNLLVHETESGRIAVRVLSSKIVRKVKGDGMIVNVDVTVRKIQENVEIKPGEYKILREMAPDYVITVGKREVETAKSEKISQVIGDLGERFVLERKRVGASDPFKLIYRQTIQMEKSRLGILEHIRPEPTKRFQEDVPPRSPLELDEKGFFYVSNIPKAKYLDSVDIEKTIELATQLIELWKAPSRRMLASEATKRANLEKSIVAAIQKTRFEHTGVPQPTRPFDFEKRKKEILQKLIDAVPSDLNSEKREFIQIVRDQLRLRDQQDLKNKTIFVLSARKIAQKHSIGEKLLTLDPQILAGYQHLSASDRDISYSDALVTVFKHPMVQTITNLNDDPENSIRVLIGLLQRIIFETRIFWYESGKRCEGMLLKQNFNVAVVRNIETGEKRVIYIEGTSPKQPAYGETVIFIVPDTEKKTRGNGTYIGKIPFGEKYGWILEYEGKHYVFSEDDDSLERRYVVRSEINLLNPEKTFESFVAWFTSSLQNNFGIVQEERNITGKYEIDFTLSSMPDIIAKSTQQAKYAYFLRLANTYAQNNRTAIMHETLNLARSGTPTVIPEIEILIKKYQAYTASSKSFRAAPHAERNETTKIIDLLKHVLLIFKSTPIDFVLQFAKENGFGIITKTLEPFKNKNLSALEITEEIGKLKRGGTALTEIVRKMLRKVIPPGISGEEMMEIFLSFAVYFGGVFAPKEKFFQRKLQTGEFKIDDIPNLSPAHFFPEFFAEKAYREKDMVAIRSMDRLIDDEKRRIKTDLLKYQNVFERSKQNFEPLIQNSQTLDAYSGKYYKDVALQCFDANPEFNENDPGNIVMCSGEDRRIKCYSIPSLIQAIWSEDLLDPYTKERMSDEFVEKMRRRYPLEIAFKYPIDPDAIYIPKKDKVEKYSRGELEKALRSGYDPHSPSERFSDDILQRLKQQISSSAPVPVIEPVVRKEELENCTDDGRRMRIDSVKITFLSNPESYKAIYEYPTPQGMRQIPTSGTKPVSVLVVREEDFQNPKTIPKENYHIFYEGTSSAKEVQTKVRNAFGIAFSLNRYHIFQSLTVDTIIKTLLECVEGTKVVPETPEIRSKIYSGPKYL